MENVLFTEESLLAAHREALKAIDRFFIDNEKPFTETFDKLTGTLGPVVGFEQVLPLYRLGITTGCYGEQSVLEIMPSNVAALILITYWHLAEDAPLLLSPEDYLRWGLDWTGVTLVRCRDCAYRYPQARKTCQLCRGRCGEEGAWEALPADCEARRVGAMVN